MEFNDAIRNIANRVNTLKDSINTEEATKTAFIMPFLQALGYDIFNPTEVVPEYVTDIGTKKGEKIDYAIFKDGHPIILIECKHWAKNLDLHDGQLLRYFHVSKAKFGILTNGIHYRFYTDLDEANKMDSKPFLEFNISEIRDTHLDKLKAFHKGHYDLEKILSTASEMKYMNALKGVIHNEIHNPSPEFVQFLVKRVYEGRLTAKLVEQFTELVKKSGVQYLHDSVNDRLKAALVKENNEISVAPVEVNQSSDDGKTNIETTVEELEAFYTVKAIMREVVEGSRITYRDAQSYFAVFFDDNNRKPICRIQLGSSKKYLITFSEDKKETKHEIEKIDDIYKFTDLLKRTATYYK
jgi:hypothetical protein